jgi:molecular chaperone GrpE
MTDHTEETTDIQNAEETILTDDLAAAQALAAKNHENYLRALADYDNLRRRTQKEREESSRFGAERIMRDLLPILDSLEKVVQMGDRKEEAFDGFLEGIHLIKKQFLGTLENHGLSPIQAKDQKFDPHIHQAIARIEQDDLIDDLVNEEFVRGYLLYEKLLRPSMVSVATPKKKE